MTLLLLFLLLLGFLLQEITAEKEINHISNDIGPFELIASGIIILNDEFLKF